MHWKNSSFTRVIQFVKWYQCQVNSHQVHPHQGVISIKNHYWSEHYGIKSSVQFSRSVVSDSLWPHGLQHARPPCLPPTSGACSNSLSRWCHPTISSSVIPFSSCLQSFPAPAYFPMSQFFSSGGQSVGASASVLPMNIQDLVALGLTRWISLQSKRLKILLQHHSFKSINSSALSFLYSPNFHIHTWLLEKPQFPKMSLLCHLIATWRWVKVKVLDTQSCLTLQLHGL